MPVKLNLGAAGAITLDAGGDLAKYLHPGIDTLIHFRPSTLNFMGARVADLPPGSVSAGFDFSTAPSWKITQAVGITLSVEPQAACTLTVLKPGDRLFVYTTGADAVETPVEVPPERCYIVLALECSLAVDAGAAWSSGSFGVSGDIASTERFRVAFSHGVDPSATFRDALAETFSRFVLPFHSASVASMDGGDCVDFEFTGNLSLGFGVTYGFSGLFLGGGSQGEVLASFASPLGKSVVTAAPCFKAGPQFKLTYSHSDVFRVVARRVRGVGADGATLHLLRKDKNTIAAKESFGITLSAGVKFKTDAGKLKSEIQEAGRKLLSGAAGEKLGDTMAAAAGAIAGEIDKAVYTRLLAEGDGKKVALELAQSHSRENTALFVYHFDFSRGGLRGYDSAMRCDYTSAIACDGVDLDPNSFVERLYLDSAGLNLQFFDLLRFQDVTEYIRKTDTIYAGARTFQIRDTVGMKSVSGIFAKQREADLYFIAQCKAAQATDNVSGAEVRLHVVLVDGDNRDAIRESAAMLAALGERAASDAVRASAHGPVRLTFDADVALFAGLALDDASCYERFARAVTSVIGPANDPARIFESHFTRFGDWQAFDRATEGNPNGDVWPAGYPPTERVIRLAVQTYILSGRAFTRFCAALKRLASDLPEADTQPEYEELVKAIEDMVRHNVPFPTYFLKPSMAALFEMASARLVLDGKLPDPAKEGGVAVTYQVAAAAVGAVG
jgi:hypothetical protein